MDIENIARAIFIAAGGESSGLRQPTRAILGHPVTGAVYIPLIDTDYPGQVWIHEPAGSYPEPDGTTDDSERDDSPPAVYTALLKAGVIPSGHVRYGLPVLVNVINNLLEIIGKDGGPAEEYTYGLPEYSIHAIDANLYNWGLMRPTDPPSMAVLVTPAQYDVDGTIYDVPGLLSVDLSSYLSGIGGNQAVVIHVRVDPENTALDYTAGSVFTDNYRDTATGIHDHAGAFANYPATNASNALFSRGWVKLWGGMSAITEQEIYYNPYFLRSPGSGLAEEDLPNVSFDNVPLARLTSGSDPDDFPQGSGDIWWDASVTPPLMYIANHDGSAWLIFDMGSILASNPAYLKRDGTNAMTGTLNVLENDALFIELGSAPSTPGLTSWSLYFKNDGLYYLDDNGAETGPLIDSGGAGGSTNLPGWRLDWDNSGSVMINSGSAEIVADYNEINDTDAFFDDGGGLDEVIIPTGLSGLYHLTATVRIGYTSGSVGAVRLRIDIVKGSGSLTLSSETAYFVVSTSDSIIYMEFSTEVDVNLNQGDDVQVRISRLPNDATFNLIAAQFSGFLWNS